MPAISGPSITEQRAAELDARFFGVDLDVGVDALDQRVREALFDGAVAPLFGLLLRWRRAAAGGFERFAEVDEALGGVGAAIEQTSSTRASAPARSLRRLQACRR